MTVTKQLQKRVRKLEQRLAPKPPPDVWARWAFPVDVGKPHGRYGFQDVNCLTREMKAVSEEEEVQLLKEYYEEELPAEAKRQHCGYSWTTFEDFLESKKCMCERCQSLSKEKELTDLLKRREEVFDLLTEGVTHKEKAEFELATIKETVNSEDFLRLLQDHDGKNQLKDKEVAAQSDDGK